MKRNFWIATCLLCAFFLLWGEIEAYGQTKIICYANADASGVMAEIPCHDAKLYQRLVNVEYLPGNWAVPLSADGHLPNAPSASTASHKQDFRELPPYHYQPFRPLHFLYAIHERPRRTALIWGIAGGTIVALLLPKQPHCSHYEPGESGVNVPCPKEYGK